MPHSRRKIHAPSMTKIFFCSCFWFDFTMISITNPFTFPIINSHCVRNAKNRLSLYCVWFPKQQQWTIEEDEQKQTYYWNANACLRRKKIKRKKPKSLLFSSQKSMKCLAAGTFFIFDFCQFIVIFFTASASISLIWVFNRVDRF